MNKQEVIIRDSRGSCPIGIIPKQIDRSTYATTCGGCICDHCANNVDCVDNATGEAEFGCFNCDECYNYSGCGTDNWKPCCNDYKITDIYAKRCRKRFEVVSVM